MSVYAVAEPGKGPHSLTNNMLPLKFNGILIDELASDFSFFAIVLFFILRKFTMVLKSGSESVSATTCMRLCVLIRLYMFK